MKICYVSNNFEIHDYRFLKKLVDNNYEVHAVSLRKDKIDRKYRISGIYYYEFCNHRKIYQKRFHGFNPFWFFSAIKFVKKIILESKPEILHGGYVTISGFICALADFHPFLLMPWGSDILINTPINFVKRKIVSYTINKADMITCDAESVKDEILKRNIYDAKKIEVFPWGIDLRIFNPDNNNYPKELIVWKNQIVVVCTRQHKKIYGIEYLIDAIPAAVEENKNLRFLFIGTGPLTDFYLNKIRRLNIADYVKFIGRMDNSILPLYLNNSDIYISLSLSDGSSLCLMEAIACGLPVIVTEIKANKEWITHNVNGKLIPVKSTADIVDTILELADDKKLCLSMKERNLQIASNRTDWDKNFSKLEIIYKHLRAVF